MTHNLNLPSWPPPSFLETFIHAKEKLNIVQWVELLTKQLDSSAVLPPAGGSSTTWSPTATGRSPSS